jgi:hypothetical protein
VEKDGEKRTKLFKKRLKLFDRTINHVLNIVRKFQIWERDSGSGMS